MLVLVLPLAWRKMDMALDAPSKSKEVSTSSLQFARVHPPHPDGLALPLVTSTRPAVIAAWASATYG